MIGEKLSHWKLRCIYAEYQLPMEMFYAGTWERLNCQPKWDSATKYRLALPVDSDGKTLRVGSYDGFVIKEIDRSPYLRISTGERCLSYAEIVALWLIAPVRAGQYRVCYDDNDPAVMDAWNDRIMISHPDIKKIARICEVLND